MYATYQAVLALHIAAALFCVVMFWIPTIARKGSPLHLRAGKLYVNAMVVMAVSALVLCAMNLTAPAGVGSVDELRTRIALLGGNGSLDSMAVLARGVRLNATWLAYLSVLLLTGLRYGTRVVQTRHDHTALRSALDVGLCAALVVSGPAMIVFGLVNRHPVITVFGALGLLNGSTWLAFIARTARTRMGWFYQHMSAMLGTGMSVHTALLLAVGRHLPGPPGAWRLLPAALTILGVPAIIIWRRYYRNRFEPQRSRVVTPSVEPVRAPLTA